VYNNFWKIAGPKPTNSLHLMKTDYLLLCVQKPTTCPSTKPD